MRVERPIGSAALGAVLLIAGWSGDRLGAQRTPEKAPPLAVVVHRAVETIFEQLDAFVPSERDSPVEALANIGAAVRAADSMHDVLLIIGEQARRALDASRVTIGRIDHDERALEVLVNVGYLRAGSERFPSNERHALDDPIGLGQVLSGDGFVRTIEERRADDSGIASLHDRRLRSEPAPATPRGN